MLSVGGLFVALPEPLVPGPNWLLLAIIFGLSVPAMITHRIGRHTIDRVLGYLISSVVTLALIWSLGELIAGLPDKRESAVQLLRSALALWVSNILVFAAWYWRLDAGGSHERSRRGRHVEGAFLFPQMNMPGQSRVWMPGFVDYLHLAFNTSTAFSPTDVAPLTRWAKMLMMVQSIISLGTIVILAGRAVNIL